MLYFTLKTQRVRACMRAHPSFACAAKPPVYLQAGVCATVRVQSASLLLLGAVSHTVHWHEMGYSLRELRVCCASRFLCQSSSGLSVTPYSPGSPPLSLPLCALLYSPKERSRVMCSSSWFKPQKHTLVVLLVAVSSPR